MAARPTHKPNRRQVAAAATRREILLAARRLFAGGGYAATSMAAIAEEAGVSIPTLYASVGPKEAIVSALAELIDEEIGGAGARQTIGKESDPTRLIAMPVHINRVLQERFGDILEALRSAAQIEPVVAEAMRRGNEMHRVGSTRVAARLHQLKALRKGVSADEAAAVIGLLTAAECYAELVGRYGWSFDRAEAWITATLRSRLLKSRRGEEL